MIKICQLALFLVFLPCLLFAQAYGTAVGMRLGGSFGITAQQQVALHTTAEGIMSAGLSSKDLSLTILGEQHNSLLTKNFNFYLGGGVHKVWLHQKEADGTTAYAGLTGIAGFELSIGNVVISSDFKPAFNIFSGGGWETQTALSVRYIFAGRYFRDESWKFWKKWFHKNS